MKFGILFGRVLWCRRGRRENSWDSEDQEIRLSEQMNVV